MTVTPRRMEFESKKALHTSALWFSRLTAALVTPGCARNAASTFPEQLLQIMPSTRKVAVPASPPRPSRRPSKPASSTASTSSSYARGRQRPQAEPQ